MKRVSHEPKSSEAHWSPKPPRRTLRSLVGLAFVAFSLMGCDIVQGFQDAGDSLFPEQSTHLAAPGIRVVDGHYRNLGVVGGTDLYLLARGADDDTGKLFSMRYDEPRPCEIPAVARYSVTREVTRKAPLFSYFSEDVRLGTLHFADATCKKYELTFEDARLPVAETKTGLVIWAGTALWLANPESGSRELLIDEVEAVTTNVFGGRFAVRAGGRLTLFDATWRAQGTFGDTVNSVQRAGSSLFYLDAVGAHRIVESDDGSGVVEDDFLVRDACSLASQDGTWVTLHSPCTDGKLLAIHEPSGDIFTLPFDADPYRLRLVPARESPGRDPLVDPFWFFYLGSGATEGTEDTLFVRTPKGDERVIGAHSTFEHLRLNETDGEPYGYALVDIQGETGNYVWWNAAGETRVLAERAMWRPPRLIVDFDGTLGSLAVTSGDRLRVVAKGVPWQAFEYQDPTRAWTVLFHDMNTADGSGQLSMFPSGIDQIESVPSDEPLAVPALTDVASDVIVLGTSSLQDLLSGVIYMTDFDLEKQTGSLKYRNLELRFTADVNEGVSDYLVSHDELLYAIPYGDNAGIWLAEGK